ncbi:BnaCnng39700D [Brassica napus]|uniref:BnaCnng39700D protein n=1 Tax=Brassica napus TaxID=3708 RepID=A0A078JD34_BRANA|nr:BnaCnng39700D [Brassica napus]
MANQTAVATVQYKPFSTFVSAGPGDSKLMFRLIHFWETCNNSKVGILIGTKMVISQKDMIAYHEHAGEASNSHPPMLDAVSNEFWEHKIVRKSNGTDIYRLQRNVKKRDMLGLYKDGFEGEKANVFNNGSFFENIKYKNFKLRVFLFVLSSTDIFNFGLFILERIRNLKPGEEQEDPERRYVE